MAEQNRRPPQTDVFFTPTSISPVDRSSEGLQNFRVQTPPDYETASLLGKSARVSTPPDLKPASPNELAVQPDTFRVPTPPDFEKTSLLSRANLSRSNRVPTPPDIKAVSPLATGRVTSPLQELSLQQSPNSVRVPTPPEAFRVPTPPIGQLFWRSALANQRSNASQPRVATSSPRTSAPTLSLSLPRTSAPTCRNLESPAIQRVDTPKTEKPLEAPGSGGSSKTGSSGSLNDVVIRSEAGASRKKAAEAARKLNELKQPRPLLKAGPKDNDGFGGWDPADQKYTCCFCCGHVMTACKAVTFLSACEAATALLQLQPALATESVPGTIIASVSLLLCTAMTTLLVSSLRKRNHTQMLIAVAIRVFLTAETGVKTLTVPLLGPAFFTGHQWSDEPSITNFPAPSEATEVASLLAVFGSWLAVQLSALKIMMKAADFLRDEEEALGRAGSSHKGSTYPDTSSSALTASDEYHASPKA